MLWLPCAGPAMPQIVSSWISGGLVLVMASSSGVLVAPAPGGPVQPVAGVPCGLGSGQAVAGLEILLTSPTKVPSGVTAA